MYSKTDLKQCRIVLQFGQQSLDHSLPDMPTSREQSLGSGPDDWRVAARHAHPHKRWPSNASRSVRGALAPAPAAWSTPVTDLAGMESH